jgi:hypothetical protein
MHAGHEGTPPEQRFEIRGHLGSGGFGTVHEAFDRQTEQRVALKELTRASPGSLVRFKNEFRALADLHHPNLVRLRELIEREGSWYIVMDLIEGEQLLDFVRPASNDPGFDERRLREAFAGIAEALAALHGAGILHRDLKPSNVRVTREGRAVLLDFGLVTAVDEERQSTHADAVGTIAYMAPEQAAGEKLTPATDWYALGASLYEALTGRMPFDGHSGLMIALEKQRSLPPHPEALLRGLPADLSELCMSLLQIAPDARPDARAVLEVLRGTSALEGPRISVMPAAPFAGREEELGQLQRAHERTRQRQLAIVLVEGESGVGKSELVAEFLRREQAREPLLLALRGRCYENEQASYKAFDTCFDELAGALRKMGGQAARVLPAHAPLLTQLFPSFAEVPALPRAALDGVSADPTARRLQGFGALAGLLRNLAAERPVLLVVDDLQWADSESFRLLRALVEHDAPPSILVLCTVRPRDELDGETLSSIDMVRSWPCTEVVSITGLPAPAASALARTLLGEHQDPSWASAIAEESRGHPLLLAELVHYARAQPRARVALTLEAALAARVERLAAPVRELLELVALAGRPHAPPVFARALRVDSVDEALTILLANRLLRARQDQVGCYHDRIRAVVVERVSDARRPQLHRGLAQALAQQRGADPSEEAMHWDLAGEPERALDAYERAARRAFDALAFAQAERQYARAIALVADRKSAHYAGLVAERAHALSCAGKSAEAATAYAEAAQLCHDEEPRLVLQSRMAVKLLQSGNLEAGLAVCRSFLAELGIRLPRSDLASVLLALWNRLRTRFSMDAVRERPEVDARTRLVMDLLHDVSVTLGVVKTTGFLVLSAQYARLAMRSGEPAYMRRSFAAEGWLRNATGGMERARPFFDAARTLGARYPDSEGIRAYEAYGEGSALLANWQWHAARDLLEEAERLHVRHHPDDPWGLIGARYSLGMAWYRMGEHALLLRRMDAWIHEAEERQDRFAVALLTGMGHGAIRHLMRGAGERALSELDDSLAHVPDEPFSFAHFGHVMLTTQVLVYAGGRAAWERLAARHKAHSRAFLFRTRVGRPALLLLRCQAALSAYEESSASERRAFLRLVRDHTRKLRREKSGFTDAFAALYDAQALALEGSARAALELARDAHRRFAELRAVGVWPARYLEGHLEGGERGAQHCAEALAFFESQGWRDARRAVRMSVPILSAAWLAHG